MGTYLDRILESHRAAARADTRALDELREAAVSAPPPRDFAGALRTPGLAVIAEVKRRSPSKGALAVDLDPGALAAAYARGGAACLSVLTDAEFFGGSGADLEAARLAVDIPVLRKDFTVSEADIYDARVMGADAVLVIAAALDDDDLARFHALAESLGMAALVEVHDEAEVRRALRVGAQLVGVNQRDLVTFEVDTDRAARVVAAIPPGVVRVAESGIAGPADAQALSLTGYDAVLVGEHLVRSDDPARAVQELIGT